MQARRVQTRAITVTTRASTACADAGDHGEDVCKAFKVKKRARKACADTGDHGDDACKQGVC